MNELFRKIDTSFTIARIFIAIVHAVVALGVIAYSIFLFVNNEIMLGMCILSVGLIIDCISFVLWSVVTSYLKDIKLIRNRLYGVSANSLASQYKLQVADPPALGTPTVIVDAVGYASSSYKANNNGGYAVAPTGYYNNGYAMMNTGYVGGYGAVAQPYNGGYANPGANAQYNGAYADPNANVGANYQSANAGYNGGYSTPNQAYRAPTYSSYDNQ